MITYDYVETASNEARELIAEFELKGDEDVLVKALVAAYCRGVDAVDGYLRNSLSAYRASVKSQQWISVKDRLPEYDQLVLIWHPDFKQPFVGSRVDSALMSPLYWWRCELDMYEPEEVITHWQPLPAPPKEEK